MSWTGQPGTRQARGGPAGRAGARLAPLALAPAPAAGLLSELLGRAWSGDIWPPPARGVSVRKLGRERVAEGRHHSSIHRAAPNSSPAAPPAEAQPAPGMGAALRPTCRCAVSHKPVWPAHRAYGLTRRGLADLGKRAGHAGPRRPLLSVLRPIQRAGGAACRRRRRRCHRYALPRACRGALRAPSGLLCMWDRGGSVPTLGVRQVIWLGPPEAGRRSRHPCRPFAT